MGENRQTLQVQPEPQKTCGGLHSPPAPSNGATIRIPEEQHNFLLGTLTLTFLHTTKPTIKEKEEQWGHGSWPPYLNIFMGYFQDCYIKPEATDVLLHWCLPNDIYL